MENVIWWHESLGRIELHFKSRDQITTIFHSGDCEESTRNEMDYFVPQLEKHSNQLLIEVLQSAGFDLSEIEKDSREDNMMRVVWMAAGDLFDLIDYDE